MSDQVDSGTPSPELQIIGAVYGLAKVTNQVVSLVNRSTNPQSLSVAAENSVFGDSWPGIQKSLTVAYRYGDSGPVSVKVVREHETLTIGSSEFQAAAGLAA